MRFHLRLLLRQLRRPKRLPEGRRWVGFAVGTADTKGEELAFSRRRSPYGRRVAGLVVDVGTRTPTITPDITAGECAAFHPDGAEAVLERQRPRQRGHRHGQRPSPRFIASRTRCLPPSSASAAAGGTSIVHRRHARLPLGLPKLMVSTLASGDIRALCRRLRHRHDALGHRHLAGPQPHLAA